MWSSCPPTAIDPGLLEQGEVHLILMPLDQPASVVEEVATTLSPDEHERAARFHFDRDRQRFVVARGLLRRFIGHYVGMPGDTIRFAYGSLGKPYLPACAGHAKLEFSLSHSGDWALAGFAFGREIGVDLEEVRAIPEYRELAEANFAPEEVRTLLELPEEQRIDGFYACWTRKEAYAKALGLGLSLDLSTFVMSVEPGEGVEIVPASQTAAAHQVWGMRPLQGFWAAAALEAQTASIDFPKIRTSIHDWGRLPGANAEITSAGACTSSMSTPSPPSGNSPPARG
jgi:4'-phosphopantetheinyl transferase